MSNEFNAEQFGVICGLFEQAFHADPQHLAGLEPDIEGLMTSTEARRFAMAVVHVLGLEYADVDDVGYEPFVVPVDPKIYDEEGAEAKQARETLRKRWQR